jgi:predicted RNase H-like nuclease (RuvC/YqgF family)
MTEDTDDNLDDGVDNENSGEAATGGERSEEFNRMVEEAANAKLARMKANQDAMSKKLEAETKARVRAEKAAADVQRAALKADGKELEAANMRIAELEEELKMTSTKLVSVTRDRELETALSSLEFRTNFAKISATDLIAKDLIQDTDGAWVHKSGASIQDYIKTLPKNDEFRDTFLKSKDNQGTGAPTNKTTAKDKAPKSFIGMSSEELLAWAAKQTALSGN